MEYKEKAIVMDEAAVGRAIVRIAHEIIERQKGAQDLVLVGIKRRGWPLASRISEAIYGIEGIKVPVGALDITFYRDDLTLEHEQPKLKSTEINVPINDQTVVLVDDVIYTGRTVRAALDAIFDIGRPASVKLAVMIDRGLRELPFKPDYVGKNLPTSHSELVSVKMKEIDGEDGVTILQRV